MIKKKKGYYILIVALGMVLMLSGILVEYLVGESRYLGFASGFGATMIGVGNESIFDYKKARSYKTARNQSKG